MNTILQTVFSLSLSGSILILLLFLLRPLFDKWAGKSWQYYIWLIVAVRLICSYSPAIPVVSRFFQTHPFVTPQAVQQEMKQAPEPESLFNMLEEKDSTDLSSVPPFSEEPEGELSPLALSFSQLPFWAGLVWIVAALLLLMKKAVEYRSFLRYLQAGKKEAEAPEILDAYLDACLHLKLRRFPALYLHPLVSSPMLVGFFKPCIILPQLDPQQVDCYYIFLHELTHYKRMDVLYKWLVQFCLCLHWFNPLLYFASREIDKQCELSCDEMVIRRLQEEEQQQYGDTLLASAKQNGMYKSTVISLTLNEDAQQLKERLGAIMKSHKKTKLQSFGAATLTAILLTAAVISGSVVSADSKSSKDAGFPTRTNATIINNKNGKTFTYRNELFYDGAYIIGVAWNIGQDSTYYPKSVTLTADKTYTLSFLTETQQYSGNSDILKSVGKFISTYQKTHSSGLEILAPAVTSVHGPYTASAKTLADQFYKEDDLAFFSAITKNNLSEGAADKRLTAKEINKIRERAFQDDEIAFFSILSDKISQEDAYSFAKRAYQDNMIAFLGVLEKYLSSEQIYQFAQEAYDDRNIAAFSIFSNRLTQEQLDDFSRKAYEDDEIAFLSMLPYKSGSKAAKELAEDSYSKGKVASFNALSDSLGKEDRAKLAEQAYQDDEIAFFNSLSDSLSQEEAAKLAKRAYQDGKIAFFNSLSDELSDQEAAALALQAYQDEQIAFFNSLSDSLSREEAAKLAKRAYQDGKMAFFNSLSDELSDQEAAALAIQAYEEGEIAYFNSLSDSLSREEAAKLAKRAYQDGKIAFFSFLSDNLNTEQVTELAWQAYQENQVAYFSQLVDDLPEKERQKLLKQAYQDKKISFFHLLSD